MFSLDLLLFAHQKSKSPVVANNLLFFCLFFSQKEMESAKQQFSERILIPIGSFPIRKTWLSSDLTFCGLHPQQYQISGCLMSSSMQNLQMKGRVHRNVILTQLVMVQIIFAWIKLITFANVQGIPHACNTCGILMRCNLLTHDRLVT